MIVPPGATSVSVDVQFLDDTGAALTGKVASDFPVTKWSGGSNTADTTITLSDLAAITTAHPNDNTAGGVKEREGGWYRLDLPNNVFTAAGRKTLTFAETTNKRIIAPFLDVQYTQADVRQLLGTNWLTPGTAGTPDVNAKLVGGTAQTGLDLGGTWTAARAAHLNADIDSRMATFSLPANFAAFSLTVGGVVKANDSAGNALATAAALANVSNNTFIGTNVPVVLERPDSGSEAVKLTLIFNDETGSPADIDSSALPTVVLVDNAGTDLSGRLSVWTHAATGKYTATYTNSASDALENIHWEITGTVNAKVRRWVGTTQLVDTTAVDFTSGDRANLNALVAGVNVTAVDGVALGAHAAGKFPVDLRAIQGFPLANFPGSNPAAAFGSLFQTADQDALAAIWAYGGGRTIDGGTIDTYTGNTPQTGDAFARIGPNGAGLTAVGAAADPLRNPVPGGYAQGTAGYALGKIGTAQVRVSAPVATGGPVTVIAGDDYRHADGRAIVWTGEDPDAWPDLTGAALTLVIGDSLVTAAGTVTQPTGNQSFYAELTAAQTTTIAAGGRRESYYVRATLAGGDKVTLAENTIYAARPGAG